MTTNCQCNEEEYKLFQVETDNAVYEFEFSEVQFEITGICNMNCKHCRGAFDEKKDLPIEQILKVLGFVRKYSPSFKEVTISGGEPFMHKQFRQLIAELSNLNIKYLTLTTNGTFISKDILEYIASFNFERVTFSVSLDSTIPEEHNSFRNHPNAYNIAINAFNTLTQFGCDRFYTSLRSTVIPSKIIDMEKTVQLGLELGVNRVSFSSVLPSGRATEQHDIQMDCKTLERFCVEIQRLYQKYKGKIHISSNEPLKWQARGKNPLQEDGKMLLDCCPAGTISFNINSNGDMTPCSLLNLRMMNIMNMTSEEIEDNYKNNPIVHNLLDRKLSGKCAACKYKCECGGCRARAYSLTGDYLGEDTNCFGGPF